jgi:hypothetical protein
MIRGTLEIDQKLPNGTGLGSPESVVDWDALIKIISAINPSVRLLYCVLF